MRFSASGMPSKVMMLWKTQTSMPARQLSPHSVDRTPVPSLRSSSKKQHSSCPSLLQPSPDTCKNHQSLSQTGNCIHYPDLDADAEAIIAERDTETYRHVYTKTPGSCRYMLRRPQCDTSRRSGNLDPRPDNPSGDSMKSLRTPYRQGQKTLLLF